MYLAYENFVGVRTIEVGSVKMGDTTIYGMMYEWDHFSLWLRNAIESRHAHASESLCRDFKALGAQLDPPHCSCHFCNLLGFLP